MSDATAEALAQRLLAAFPADRDYARADLDALPGPVARLLAARLDARADRAAAAPDSPWVDAEERPVRDAVRQLQEACRAAARVPASRWAEEVERAARLALAHLVAPAATLAAYAVEDEPVATGHALRRIEAFAPYPYLPEIAGRYVERKGLTRIDRAGLERLLERIDRRMVTSFDLVDWMTLLEPLVDLVGPLDGGAVPTDLLVPLFEAKGADALAAAVADAEALTPDALRQRLATVLPAAPEHVAAAPSEPTSAPEPDLDSAPEAPALDRAPALDAVAPPADEAAEADPLPSYVGVDTEMAEAMPAEEAVDAHPPTEALTPPEAEDEPTVVFGADLDPAPDPSPAAAAENSASDATPDADDRPRPPVIGSRYGSVEETFVDDSEVIGGVRPVSSDEAPTADGVQTPPTDGDAPALEDDASDASPATVSDSVSPVAFEPAAPLAPPAVAPLAPVVAAPNAMPAADDEPLWRRIARQQSPQAAAAVTEEETPLWKQFAHDPEAPIPAPAQAAAPLTLDELEGRVLGDDDDRRDWFVDELFSGSPSAYHQTLASLDDARSWTEATQIIAREVFRKHRVNIYSEPAVAFTDAVEAQVRARVEA